MSLGGGHWVWTASLRYGWIVLFLSVGLVATGRGGVAGGAAQRAAHWWFWLLAGSVGFGIFYTGISFAASRPVGWWRPRGS
ncbi:MAG: multidrug resistance efflux transporter family protein [Caldilineaceae bacterium]